MSLFTGLLNYIEVRFKNHNDMRYDTLGDYYYVDYNNVLRIDISNSVNREEQLLTLVHELVESILVEKRGIGFGKVDNWDLKHITSRDPGRLRNCPYRHEHMFASRVEEMLRNEMDRRLKCRRIRG